MKPWAVNIVLLLSVIAAIYFYRVKFSGLTNEDRIKNGLEGVKKYLPANSHIVIKCDMPDGTFSSLAAYFLVPAKPIPPSKTGGDTILILQPLNSTDSASAALINNSKVLWQNKDDKYVYFLLFSGH